MIYSGECRGLGAEGEGRGGGGAAFTRRLVEKNYKGGKGEGPRVCYGVISGPAETTLGQTLGHAVILTLVEHPKSWVALAKVDHVKRAFINSNPSQAFDRNLARLTDLHFVSNNSSSHCQRIVG